jgi:hypothetical protein
MTQADGTLLMQHFSLIHDGSKQGWQAAYLAFHIAAQLGAPLSVLQVGEPGDENKLTNRAAQVEVGGHAAGVVIETRWIREFNLNTVKQRISNSNGLFLPRHLIPDENTARGFLEALSCPLWLASKEIKTQGVAMLVADPAADDVLIQYAAILSQRIQQSLTGLVLESKSGGIPKSDTTEWLSLPDFSQAAIKLALKRVNVSLLVLPVSKFLLAGNLPVNCVLYPD